MHRLGQSSLFNGERVSINYTPEVVGDLREEIVKFYGIEPDVNNRQVPGVVVGEPADFAEDIQSIAAVAELPPFKSIAAALSEVKLRLGISSYNSGAALPELDGPFIKELIEDLITGGGNYFNQPSQYPGVWVERIYILSSLPDNLVLHALTHELIHFLHSDGRGNRLSKDTKVINEAVVELLTLSFELKTKKLAPIIKYLRSAKSDTVGYFPDVVRLSSLLQLLGHSEPITYLANLYFDREARETSIFFLQMDLKEVADKLDSQDPRIIAAKRFGLLGA